MMPVGPTLRDIHMPPPASWWPLAPGWWFLIAVLVILIALLVWYARRRRLPRRRWHAARHELTRLRARQHNDSAAFAADVSQLLRRAARLRDPATVGLRGEAWHAALRRLAGPRVPTEPLEGLEQAMYQPDPRLDSAAVGAAAHAWLRRVLLHGGRRA